MRTLRRWGRRVPTASTLDEPVILLGGRTLLELLGPVLFGVLASTQLGLGAVAVAIGVWIVAPSLRGFEARARRVCWSRGWTSGLRGLGGVDEVLAGLGSSHPRLRLPPTPFDQPEPLGSRTSGWRP